MRLKTILSSSSNRNIVIRFASSGKDMNIDTFLANLGSRNNQYGALVPPIHLSTTFERNENYQLNQFEYIRHNNPTRLLFEKSFAELEGGSQSLAFSSGMAASSAILLSDPTAHVIMPDDMYMSSYIMLDQLMPWMTKERIDMTNTSNLEICLKTAVGNKRNVLLWLESPSNPRAKVTDIKEVCQMARRILGSNVCIAFDGTWSTPYLLKGLSLGCDIVWHSCTKYIGGHSDVLGGVITVAGDTSAAHRLLPKLMLAQHLCGGVMSPWESYMLLRGMRTLHVRMDRHCSNAMSIAQTLEKSPAVLRVMYPGLPSHPQYEIAKKQFDNKFGGMMSFLLRDATDVGAIKVAQRLKLFHRATSLGGTESLVEHRRSVDGISPPNLLRLSIGLENISDLTYDILQALN